MIDPNRQKAQKRRKHWTNSAGKNMSSTCVFHGWVVINSQKLGQGVSKIQKAPSRHPIGLSPPGYPASIAHCSLLERPEARRQTAEFEKYHSGTTSEKLL